MSDSLQPHGLQHTRPPCPSPTPGAYSNSCPSSRWRHPTISSSVVPFSSCPQSFPAPQSFQMSQLFTSGGQSIGVSASASVLPMNIQGWFSLGWTDWISLNAGLPHWRWILYQLSHKGSPKWNWKSLSPVRLCDPMDYTVHGVLQARILEWVAFSLLQQTFQTQESNWGLLHCRGILYQLSYQGSPL